MCAMALLNGHSMRNMNKTVFKNQNGCLCEEHLDTSQHWWCFLCLLTSSTLCTIVTIIRKECQKHQTKRNINMKLIRRGGHAHKTRDRENVGGATSATELCHCNAKSSLHGKNDVLRPCSIELHFVTLNCKWHSQTQQWQKHWKSALQWLLPNQLVGSENIDDLHCNQEHLTHKPIWMTQVLLNPSWIKWRDLHLINVFFTVFFDLQFAVLACPCAALLSWCGSGEKPPILCQTLQQACVRSATSPWSASSVPVRLWFCSATKNPQKRLTC